MTIYDHTDLATEMRIPMRGPITFPLIGIVQSVRGRTVADFSAELKRRLEKDYLQKADITISVKEFGHRRAYVCGSVAHPSSFEIDPYSQITVRRAISEAGDFTVDANRSGVAVIHIDPADGSTSVEKVAILSPEPKDTEVRPDDVIIVPRLDRVFITGQVNLQGPIDLPSEELLTVSKAVSLAGGFDKYAKQSDVQLLRSGQLTRVDVAGILSGSRNENDPTLCPGDSIYVPARRY